MQLVLTPRIHRSLGVGFALRIMPLGLVGGCIALLLTGSLLPGALLIAVAGMKLGEGALRYSLDQGTRELLFVPVPEESRARVKAFIDVFVQRLARALAAVLLLTVTFGWISPLGATWLSLGLLGVWLLLTVSVRRQYVASFREGLLARRIDPGGAAGPVRHHDARGPHRLSR